MFKSRILPIATLLLGLALFFTSFNWSDKAEESQIENSSSAVPSTLAMTSNASTKSSVLDVPVVTLSSKPVLHIGDVFPLLKTVEQRVTQQRAGKPVMTTARLTAKLLIEVVDIVADDVASATAANRTAGDLLLSVRYESVKFTQDIPGQEVDYDSEHSTTSVPAAVRPYHALVGQGFQFWLQRGGEVRELAGFQDFMQACLRDVSAEQRTEAWKSMAETSPRDQIANFIDESVGLLPAGPLQLNNSWQRTQQVSHPVPIELSMQYTLREIGADEAVVSIGGTVQPGVASSAEAVQIEIQGGRVTGQATIDRRSGLPVSSQIDREIQMAVKVPGQDVFEQIKQTRSRITSLYQETMQQNLPLAGASGANTSTR